MNSGKVAEWQSGKVIKTFRDLLVWQRGMELTREVYIATRAMPKAEMFALTSQMRRAASSIPMNIAEGFGQHTRPKFVNGLRIAVGSLNELMTAYELAVSMNPMPPSPRIPELLAEEDRLLGSLIAKLEAKTKAEQRTSRRTR
ncbi:MAG: four helix bundle protein [Phycisphaerae bacterium]